MSRFARQERANPARAKVRTPKRSARQPHPRASEAAAGTVRALMLGDGQATTHEFRTTLKGNGFPNLKTTQAKGI